MAVDIPYRGMPDARGRTAGRLRAGLIAVLFVVAGGTAGYMIYGYGLLDALFQTVITVTTVGYGEIHQFGAGTKVFTIVLIFAGVGTAGYTFSALIETLVEGYLGDSIGRRRMQQRIHTMHGHVIVCGWGRVGRSISRYLQAANTEIVVIDSSAERIATVDAAYIHGDASDEEILRAAGIERARVLVTALNADADNLYVTLTARGMRPDLLIVSRAASEPAVAKLLQAGANRVVNPQNLGGTRMAALAIQPHVAEFLDVVMHDGSLEFRLEQVGVRAGSPLVGQSLRSARVHDRTGTLVLAMRHPGAAFRTNPPPTSEIASGDVLIVIGDAAQVAALRALAESSVAPR
ncbi:MAG TPA: potassium channel protein [Pseudonocardia sp.]|jgi:voltage-gated potassium channel